MKAISQVKHPKPDLFNHDLPTNRLKHYLTKEVVAIDTETRGLVIPRDRLCLIQICDDDGVVSCVRFNGKDAPNINQLLTDQKVLKLFHYARFDIAVLKYYLGVWTSPAWCTKIASKLVRTYTDKHSLKDLAKELLNLDIDKSDQTSDWAKEDLSDSQIEYAANDVRILLSIQRKLKYMLEREGRLELAHKLFSFLPTICQLDLNGFHNIFDH